ncbi:MAG TPA: decaprenyl-phosphate phosphoribosyltransferase [Acidimicrobiales bacterium]|nr:decaprenyl-phosphate phosphoribosyltransferase [Acidimicrobiales bacterium]
MADTASPPGTTAGLLRLARPRQWSKNVLVFAAPGAAGVLTEADGLAASLVAFVAFCLAASGTYYLNDANDVEADRCHPTKCHRPVASGAVPVGLARVLGVALVAAGILVGFATGSWELPAVTAGYVALTTAYTQWLKHVAVLDIATVAAGFVIRALAGAAATGVDVSDWFLVVASFGSLFMVAGKRSAELAEGGDVVGQRAVLGQYSPQFLVYVRSVASGVTLLAYTLFALERAQAGDVFVWFELSIIPFVLAILRYALRLDQGDGGAPEDIVLGDRILQVLGLVWVVTFAVGVYGS